jgi:YHS domain-containing protein
VDEAVDLYYQRGMRTFLSALVLASSLVLPACGGSTPPAADPAGAPAAAATAAASAGAVAPKPMGEAKVGDTTLCPVSGEDFVVAADSPKVELDGKTYYFCCPGCAKKFQADPQKYMKKPAS